MYCKIKVKYWQLIVEAYHDFTRLYTFLYDVCILLHHIYIKRKLSEQHDPDTFTTLIILE